MEMDLDLPNWRGFLQLDSRAIGNRNQQAILYPVNNPVINQLTSSIPPMFVGLSFHPINIH